MKMENINSEGSLKACGISSYWMRVANKRVKVGGTSDENFVRSLGFAHAGLFCPNIIDITFQESPLANKTSIICIPVSFNTISTRQII
jgi:hypothetical protein